MHLLLGQLLCMSSEMWNRIGIIGGGPAGLYCAKILAESGKDVTLFDHKIPFEKPCGGGITQKTFRDFQDLEFLKSKSKQIESFGFSVSTSGKIASANNPNLLSIISRKTLGTFLLNSCKSFGVKHISEKVIAISDSQVATEFNKYSFDFIVGADGANGISRRLLSDLKYDRWGGLGFYIDGLNVPQADIFFDIERTGYLWVFPRQDHASVGFIALKGNISKLDAQYVVQKYLDKHYNGFKVDQDKYYSATIPLTRKFETDLLFGKNWALIGDCAGLVDPITGEGIYYAFASGRYLAEAIIKSDITDYGNKLNSEIIPDLQKSADIFFRFYKSWVLTNMVRLGHYSPTISDVLVKLIAGEQSYRTLKKNLIRKIPKVVKETVIRMFERNSI